MSKSETCSPGNIPLKRSPNLVLIMDTPKGRGVFASAFILKGTIVEVCPVLLFTEDEVKQHTSQTCLEHYTYYWPSREGKSYTQALALGLGSMFNHSNARQNVTWTRDVQSECLTYTAHRDILAGEELCISYGHARLWFKDTDAPEDDQYSRIQAKILNGETDIELELSGLGEMEL